DIKRTGKPAVKAVSSSKVKMYIGFLKIMYSTPTRRVKINNIHTCSVDIVTIELNKNCWILTVAPPWLSPINTRATAIQPDINIAIDISDSLRYTFPKYSSKMAARTTTIIFVHVGLVPINKPKATPAREMCESVSAIKD